MEIIKELLVSYGLTPDEKTIQVVQRIIELGFDNCWLRNMCIIKEFDELYKTDVSQTEIYLELGDKHKIHHDSIRRIVANRRKYEI